MKKIRVTGLTIAMLSVMSILYAQGWKLSLGVSYRDFDDVDFAPQSLTPSGYNYANGNVEDLDNFVIEGAQQFGPWNQDAITLDYESLVTFDNQQFNGDSSSADEDGGIVLNIEYPFYLTENGISFSFAAGVGYFSSDADIAASSGNGITATTVQELVTWTGPLDPIIVGYPSNFPVVISGGVPIQLQSLPTPGASAATTAATLRMDMDLDLYVLSFGVTGAYNVADNLQLTVGAGPTINVADFETSAQQHVTWISDGSTVYKRSEDDSTTKVLLGAYLSLGGRYQLNELWSLGAEYRYDEVFSEVESSIADMELDGHSGTIQLIRYF